MNKLLVLLVVLVGCDERKRIDNLEKWTPTLRCSYGQGENVALCVDVNNKQRWVCYLPADKLESDPFCVPAFDPKATPRPTFGDTHNHYGTMSIGTYSNVPVPDAIKFNVTDGKVNTDKYKVSDALTITGNINP